MRSSSINNRNQRYVINKTCTFNQPIIWFSICSRQCKHFTTSLLFLGFCALRTSMTFFTTVVTSHHSHSAIIGHMAKLPTLETLLISTLTVHHTMSCLTTLEALNGRTRISATRLLPTTGSLITPIIRLTMIHLLLTFPINIPSSIRLGVSKIFLQNPTTVHQIRKPSDALIPNTLLDLITKTILKLDTFGKFSICIVSVMSIILRQLSKFRSILTYSLITLLEFQKLNL